MPPPAGRAVSPTLQPPGGPFGGGVPSTRRVDTTSPLLGGGELSGNLLLGIPAALGAANGYMSGVDKDKLDEVGAGAVTAATAASLAEYGISRLSTSPSVATQPIACGDNDPRLTDSRAPTGAASGDLSGTYPGPTLAFSDPAFGDGSDGEGSVGVGIVEGLSRDMFYNNLTVEGTLKTLGYRIYVRRTLTTVSGGIIENNGASALGVFGAIAGPEGTLRPGEDGGNSSFTNGSDGGSTVESLGGAGGFGGDGPGGAPGAGGTTTPPSTAQGTVRSAPNCLLGGTFALSGASYRGIEGGAGGGGGAGDGIAVGGGGGAGGGVVLIAARTIVNNGSIQAFGGDGSPGEGVTRGGGGGGGGGTIVLTYRTISGAGTLSVSGGKAGTGGLPAGTAGLAGTVIQVGGA